MSRRTVLASAILATVLSSLALPQAGAVDDPNNAYPTDGCSNYTDSPTGDAYPMWGIASTKTSNDPDLDLTKISFHATPVALKVFVGVDHLQAKPVVGAGNAFDVNLTVAGKTIILVERFVSGQPTLSSHYVKVGTNSANAATSTSVKLDVLEDVTKSFVVFTLDRPTLEAAAPGALADGATVTWQVSSGAYEYTGNGQDYHDIADTAAPPASSPYHVGIDDVCFPPPPATITNVGVVKSQFSDAAAVKAKLVSASGAALVGKTVTFTLGGKTATATTGADGIAAAALDPGVVAGTSYTLVAAFAGDSTAGAATVSTPFTVTTEVTKLTLKVVKSGSARTVYATLKDDDGKVLAGQSVTWYINGKKISTLKTNSAGQVVLKTAKPTQTVMAKFLGLSGKYAAVSVSAKV